MKKIILICIFVLIIVVLGDKKQSFNVEECSVEQNIYHNAIFKQEKECSRISLVTKMIEYYDCSSHYYKKISDTYTIQTINSELSSYNIPKEQVKFHNTAKFFYTDNFPVITKDASKQKNFSHNNFVNDVSFSMTLKNKDTHLIKEINQTEYQNCLIDLKNKNTIFINYFYGIEY